MAIIAKVWWQTLLEMVNNIRTLEGRAGFCDYLPWPNFFAMRYSIGVAL